MRIGDYFDPHGYNVLAVIETDLGRLQLLGNNSTHYLLVSQEDESMTDGETSGHVRLERLFPYDGSNALQVQVNALSQMVHLFATHSTTSHAAVRS